MAENLNLLDFQKVFYHPERVREFLSKGDCFPIHLDIGFTDYCNHNCLWCWTQHETSKKDKTSVEPEPFLDFLKQAYDLGLKAVTIVGTGEPFLHPQADYLIEEISKIGIKQGIFTNATTLNETNLKVILDNLTFLRVSLDAATPETHTLLHRCGDGFQKAIAAVKYLISNRKGRFPTLGIQFVMSHHNIHEAIAAAELAKNLGTDYIAFKPMKKNPLNPLHDKNILVLNEHLKEIFSKLRKFSTENFKVYIKESQLAGVLEANPEKREYKKCLGQCFSASLSCNGDLWPCCDLEGYPEFIFGNMHNSSFKEIWEGEKRKQIMQSIDVLKCPVPCRLDPLNRILDGLEQEQAEKAIREIGKSSPEMHPDFI